MSIVYHRRSPTGSIFTYINKIFTDYSLNRFLHSLVKLNDAEKEVHPIGLRDSGHILVQTVGFPERALIVDEGMRFPHAWVQGGLSAGDGSRLMIVLPDEVSAGVVGSDAHKEEIKELIAGKTGRKVEIDVCHVEEGRRFEDSFADIEAYIKEAVHMDLTVEDD